MPSRTLRNLLLGLIGLTVLVTAFTGGMLVGWSMPTRLPLAQALHIPQNQSQAVDTIPTEAATAQPTAPSASPDELKTLFNPFWEAWQIVHDRYIQQPVDDKALMRGAIHGMLQGLGDEHSSYMDPDQLREISIPMEGGYEGIGAWVDTSGQFLTITSPMPGSPAEAAGLKPGDQVIAIDGQDMTGIDGNLVIRKVIGPAGSTVKLTILRKGDEKPFDVEVTRAKITVPSVESKMLDGNIAYVRLSTFGENTDAEFRAALKELLLQKPVGLVFDLRYNGGGYLSTSVEIASEFISSGVILFERHGDGSQTTYKASSGGLATDIPLVVLVNEGSASASEIVAGAIQDYGRGKLVGATTFGKGSVQDWVELKNGEGAVRVTIAHWYTPKDRLIDKTGLKPDVEVTLTEEDIAARKDTQLEKAIELLSGAN